MSRAQVFAIAVAVMAANVQTPVVAQTTPAPAADTAAPARLIDPFADHLLRQVSGYLNSAQPCT